MHLSARCKKNTEGVRDYSWMNRAVNVGVFRSGAADDGVSFSLIALWVLNKSICHALFKYTKLFLRNFPNLNYLLFLFATWNALTAEVITYLRCADFCSFIPAHPINISKCRKKQIWLCTVQHSSSADQGAHGSKTFGETIKLPFRSYQRHG